MRERERGGWKRKRDAREKSEKWRTAEGTGIEGRPAAEAVLMERVLSLSLTIKAIKRREGWALQELEFIDQHGVSRSIRRKLYV
jgi:hypothetical protein